MTVDRPAHQEYRNVQSIIDRIRIVGAVAACIALSTGPSAGAECGKSVSRIPEGLFVIAKSTAQGGSIHKINVFASRKLTVVLNGSSLFSVSVARPGGSAHSRYCTSQGFLRDRPEIIEISEAPLGAPLEIQVSNVGDAGGPKISVTVYGDLNPDWEVTPDKLVRRKLSVFVFENATLAVNAREHVAKALQIWRSVGIDFEARFTTFSGAKVAELLGEDRILQGFFSEADTDVGEWQDRQRLQALKPQSDAFALFFAKGNLGLNGSTRADPYRTQVYIDQDVFGAPVGRTVAHELGHLLLGSGHTGNPGVPWTSGLMRAGSGSNATDISDADAEMARRRAQRIP